MILLHEFIKKSQKTPKKEIDLAVKRQLDLANQVDSAVLKSWDSILFHK